jgi:hypothetical protein
MAKNFTNKVLALSALMLVVICLNINYADAQNKKNDTTTNNIVPEVKNFITINVNSETDQNRKTNASNVKIVNKTPVIKTKKANVGKVKKIDTAKTNKRANKSKKVNENKTNTAIIAPELIRYETGYFSLKSSGEYEGILWHPVIMLKFKNTTNTVIQNTKIKVVFFINMEEIGRMEDYIIEMLPYTETQRHLLCSTGAKRKEFIESDKVKIWCNVYINNNFYTSVTIDNIELKNRFI